MNKDTLLIVDDTLDSVQALYDFLIETGFEVLTAEDGEEGINVVELVQPDLILLDVLMPPGIDGFKVCQYLKSQKNLKEIPVIFMTALTDVVDKVKGFKLGAADYITKPFQQEEVLARINAHLTIRKQHQQLQQHHEELDAFAHTVAHDLKNPVANVISITDFLLDMYSVDTPLDSKGRKGIQLLRKTGQRAFDIINALLTLCRVSRQVAVKIKPLDMSKIVQSVIQEHLVSMIEEYQAVIDLPNSWPLVLGYAPWVEEVWINYLSNGLKYGGQPPHLVLGVDCQDENGMIRFWVRDNGKGLSQKEIAQLFIPFTRLVHPHQKGREGHGLGLSIVHKIVEQLGGQVGIESELGQGSVFYFTLPVYNDVLRKIPL